MVAVDNVAEVEEGVASGPEVARSVALSLASVNCARLMRFQMQMVTS